MMRVKGGVKMFIWREEKNFFRNWIFEALKDPTKTTSNN
jgi:hypothetical protein